MSSEPAGWRPDPTGAHQYRYWDGKQWTDRVTDDAVASTTRDPLATGSDTTGPSGPERRPPGSPGSLGGAHDDPAMGGHAATGAAAAATGHQVGWVVRKVPTARLLVAVGTGTAAVIAAVVLLVLGSGGGATGDDAGEADDDHETAETPAAEANEELRAAMQAAADELVAAGTFSFEAEMAVPLFVEPVEDGDPVEADPIRIDVQGEVRLPDTLRLRLDGAQSFQGIGVQEQLVSGGTTWRRATAFPDTLDDIPWTQEVPGTDEVSPRGGRVPDLLQNVPDAFAATLVPHWLASAVDHEDGGTDEGYRVIAARIGDERLSRAGAGPQPPLRDATVRVTVDHTGSPLRVVLSARSGVSMLSATYDLAAIGDPVAAETPGPDEIDPLPAVNQHDLAAVAEEGVIPVGLTTLPDGWRLVAADTVIFPEVAILRCPTSVTVAYAGPSTGWLQLIATRPTPECAPGPVNGPSFTAGEHEGTLFEPSEEQRSRTVDVGFGPVVVDDLTVVDFNVAELSVLVIAFDVPNLPDVLAALGPVDPAEQDASPPVGQPPEEPPSVRRLAPGLSGRQPG